MLIWPSGLVADYQDIIVGVVGILMLLEATRRALGPPLMIVAAVFIAYSLFGPYMPGIFGPPRR